MSDTCPEISIIMPSHNSEGTIKQSIMSALSQTFKKFELIVINDCLQDSNFVYL